MPLCKVAPRWLSKMSTRSQSLRSRIGGPRRAIRHRPHQHRAAAAVAAPTAAAARRHRPRAAQAQRAEPVQLMAAKPRSPTAPQAQQAPYPRFQCAHCPHRVCQHRSPACTVDAPTCNTAAARSSWPALAGATARQPPEQEARPSIGFERSHTPRARPSRNYVIARDAHRPRSSGFCS
jgi:hypothetical protein